MSFDLIASAIRNLQRSEISEKDLVKILKELFPRKDLVNLLIELKTELYGEVQLSVELLKFSEIILTNSEISQFISTRDHHENEIMTWIPSHLQGIAEQYIASKEKMPPERLLRMAYNVFCNFRERRPTLKEAYVTFENYEFYVVIVVYY